jgi:hypothetical protein
MRGLLLAYAALLAGLAGLAVVYNLWAHRPGALALLLVGLLLGAAAFFLLRRIAAPELAPRRERAWLLGILGLALVVRVAWCAAVPTFPVSDARGYQRMAVDLVERGEFDREDALRINGLVVLGPPHPTAFWMPGYPLLLAAGYRVFGVTLWWGYVLNFLLAAGMQLALFYVVRCFAGGFWGLLAAATVGFYPAFVVTASVLTTDAAGPAWLAIAAALGLASVRHAGRQRLALAAACGLVMGATVHFRPVLLPLVLVIAVGLYVLCLRPAYRRGTPALPPLAFLLMIAATLVPWVARNYVVLGRPILLTSASAQAMYVNNVAYDTDDINPKDPLITQPNEALRISLMEAAAQAWIRAHPGRYALRGAKRLGLAFASDHELLGMAAIQGPEGRERDLLAPPVRAGINALADLSWGFWFGAALAAMGAAAGGRRRYPTLPPAAQAYVVLGLTTLLWLAVAVFATASESRYHYPWVPLAIGSVLILAARRPEPVDPTVSGPA